MLSSIVYRHSTGLYVNMTNRCPTACVFCIKKIWKMNYNEYFLDLQGKEPSTDATLGLINAAWTQKPFTELVFCGYGEPAMRLPEILEICRKIRSGGTSLSQKIKIRLNTSGLANLIWNRDMVPEMAGNIDSVNISANTADPEQWKKLMNPKPEFAESGFQGMADFTALCAKTIAETTITVVEMPGVDMNKCRELAGRTGAAFKLRPLIGPLQQ